jgi:PAS domain S-box-containing protein
MTNNTLLKGFVNALSLLLVLCTGLMEYYTNLGALLAWGYLVGIGLTAVYGKRTNAIFALVLSICCMIVVSLASPVGTLSDRILIHAYMALGLFLTTLFVLLAIQRKARAQLFRGQMTGIFAHSTQGIILTNDIGEIILVNSAIEHLFGYTNEELHDKSLTLLIPQILLTSSIKHYEEIHTSVLKPLVIEHQDLLGLRKDTTTLPVEISLNHFESGGTLYRAAFVTDITIRKMNQGILEAQKKELEIVNKELDSFSYSVSHDLRAPLRAVGGYAQMLEEDYAHSFDADGRRLLQNINRSAQRMGVLIDDLLAFSRLGRKEIQKGRVNMAKLTEVSLAEINVSITHHANISIGKLHSVMADASLMTRVMINLLSNAIKYSANCENPQIKISSVLADNIVTFSIQDNGVGFDMQYVHKLFGVFQRLHTESEFEGTGVGLAIANRIIQKHGGKIWAEARENQGACFYFSLPHAEELPLAVATPNLEQTKI